LVVLGHTGFISLEAMRWLADIKAGYLQIDADGRVLASFGPPGTDRPALRRAQALAGANEAGLSLSRWLVDAKLGAQLSTLDRFSGQLSAVEALAAYRSAADTAETIEELRVAEAWAANVYWQAMANLPVRFARRDADVVPSHWRTFGGRSSPLANGPRLAANPANAVLNYLYALLEGEASLAARTVGLDPSLGVMHVDQAYRDSLAADLMEPIRPLVDAFTFELMTSRPFAAHNFHETRAGVCRVTPPLTHELAATVPRWRLLVGRVTEDFAARLLPASVGPGRTPISGRRRAEARPTGPRSKVPTRVPLAHVCTWCGQPAAAGRRTCSEECRQGVQALTQGEFVASSADRQRERWATGDHPAHTSEARRKLSKTQKGRRAAETTWDREHPEPPDYDRFQREVAARMVGLSASAIARATGLSVAYCSAIKQGNRIPHARWWSVIERITDD
jgi:CRISPR-associated endonuclease Cas1